MEILILGLFLFLGTHSISMLKPRWREMMVARLGLPAWQGLYSLVSLLGFGLMIWGYGLARQHPLPIYQPALWLSHLSLLLMLPVFPLLIATHLPGHIQRWAKHPTLLATMLWALAHLLANGNLGDLLLFGGFLSWAILDRLSLRQRVGAAVRTAPDSPYNDFIAVLMGLALYGLFIVWLHEWMMGLAPIIR